MRPRPLALLAGLLLAAGAALLFRALATGPSPFAPQEMGDNPTLRWGGACVAAGAALFLVLRRQKRR